MGSQADGDGRTTPGEYVMCAGYALGADDGCIAEARHHAAVFLDQARTARRLPVSARATDLTQLVVSELVTNARKYAPGPVRMDLRITVDSVDVIVWDSDPTIPEAKTADPGRIGQHGLEIVKAVSEHLSIRQEPAGKRILARIALADAPGGDRVARGRT
ncbi:ATP-binding protein [Streptomyces sp. NPDC007904]|uniref:ATP-binding protein n=1 Tax=Streptomyces sp. NPDC007904 TaxID=3364787 RepID=UPI0036E2548D